MGVARINGECTLVDVPADLAIALEAALALASIAPG